MKKNTSVALGDHFTQFVDNQVSTGRFGSASEVVRAGLRLLEDQEEKLHMLRSALIDGEESGAAAEFDIEAMLARKNTERAE
ncbi:MAG: type II toxin-antitoxin system ParD family antitoxin [Rhodospirillaceae bacterium]|nr:type II toxin-antitoxin system ParD family antitoxin [Rhodospirillaceae bacterium]